MIIGLEVKLKDKYMLQSLTKTSKIIYSISKNSKGIFELEYSLESLNSTRHAYRLMYTGTYDECYEYLNAIENWF